MSSEIVDQVTALLHPILQSLGLSLWDLDFKKEGPQWLLRIYIDRETGGVGLDDCERVSRDLSAILDVEDVIPHAYRLEVSSPGLDRALTRPEHFTRFIGSLVRVKTYKPLENEKVFLGRLAEYRDDIVTLTLAGGERREFGRSDIAKASLEVEW